MGLLASRLSSQRNDPDNDLIKPKSKQAQNGNAVQYLVYFRVYPPGSGKYEDKNRQTAYESDVET